MNTTKIAKEILEKWFGPSYYKTKKDTIKDWSGPEGEIWCVQEGKNVKIDECKDCPETCAIDVVDQRPSKYLRPTDISW